MADSSNSNVFIQVQGVLNEDWINSSNKKLTEVLEEIESIEGVEIRFQRGTHVVLGTVHQLLDVENLLLGKARDSGYKETAFKNLLKDLETGGDLATDSYDEITSDKAFVKTADKIFVKTEDKTFVKTEDRPFVKTADKTFAKTEDKTFVKTADKTFVKTADTTFVKTERPHEAQSPTELMVDRDIWEYIESKKQNDVRQLQDVFGAVITKVEDESGVLRLILKTKSQKTGNDNLQIMLESLGALYQETVIGCVTEVAQFQLSDEERELAIEHISAQFYEVLVKKCIYTNDVLFIGPLYDARDARHQFQMVARRLVNGDLRTPLDKRGHHQLGCPSYPHAHPPGATNPNDYEESGFYKNQYLNRVNGQTNDFSSGSKYDRDEGVLGAYDDRTRYPRHDIQEKHDFNDKFSWNKKQGNDNILKSNSSSMFPQYPADKGYVPVKSDAGQKFQTASRDKHVCNDPEPNTKKSNARNEDIISSLENLTLGEARQGKDKSFQASKSNMDDLQNPFSTELDDVQQQHVVATDSTALTKATKKTKKAKSNAYEFPKVAIVKQEFEAASEPGISDEPSMSSSDRTDEIGRSFTTEALQTGQKRIQNAEKQNGQVGLGNRPEERDKGGDKSTEKLSLQETIQNILENVENSEKKVNVKESVKRDTDNLRPIEPSTSNKKEVLPQPADGTIACIIDKGFHLDGCPKSGTIEISMTFESGFQGADQPEPGRRYQGMKLKAFLPASGDGREVLRLTKSAFAARKLFQIKRNEIEGENDIIVPNGVLFKEATDQFPDPDYLPNVIEQLKRLTE